jgi:Fe-S-cluster containining protein
VPIPRDDEGEDQGGPARQIAVRRALKELAAVWAKADALMSGMSCPASGECCRLATTGREPFLLPLERLALERALARQGRPMPGKRADGACALLDESGRRCSIYPDRPFGCRTFFCAGRAPRTDDVYALSARLTRASDSIEPQGECLAISMMFGQEMEPARRP